MARFLVTRHYAETFDYFQDIEDAKTPAFVGGHRAAWTFHSEELARDIAGALNSYYRHPSAGASFVCRVAELRTTGVGMLLIGTPHRIYWRDWSPLAERRAA